MLILKYFYNISQNWQFCLSSECINLLKRNKCSWSTLSHHWPKSKKVHKMKLSEAEMKMILKPGVLKVSEIFSKHGFEIRVSGGAVRDLLRGIVPTDIDFATIATPVQMKEMFEKEGIRMINLGGEKHGTITVRVLEENFECTTLRIDKVTDGRHAQVQFVNDWKLDASRRDLTVNALFLGLDGTVYDYHDGIKHLKNNLVLFVGNPDTRIQEDYLRILRYFRFFGRLVSDANSHDQSTLESIKRNCEGLSIISGERIWVEIRKVITGRFGADVFSKMLDCGVGQYIGITNDFDCENMKKVSCRLENCQFDPCTLLASGFTSKEDALTFIQRVKCSNRERDTLLFIINYRPKDSPFGSVKGIQDTLVQLVYREKKDRKFALFLVTELAKYSGRRDLLKHINNDLIPIFPIKGGMLINRVAKKKIHSQVNRLLEFWIQSDYTLREEELLNKIET